MQRIMALALVVGAAVIPAARVTTAAGDARRCSLVPGGMRAVVVVERDTLMRLAGTPQEALAYSSSSARGPDSTLATAETLMPSARVRLLQLDSASRAVLAAAGITNARPRAYIQAAPYRADCRTIRWTDTASWTQAGDTGYVVATLASQDRWIDGTPLLVIADAWSYPYPRNRGLVAYPPSPGPFASPDALFSFAEGVGRGRDVRFDDGAPSDSLWAHAIAWARAHVEQREREPIRSHIRNLIARNAFARIDSLPSRLRGTYRVDMRSGDTSATWQFRTVDRPAYRSGPLEAVQSISDMINRPFGAGYQLVGYAADSTGAVPVTYPRRVPFGQTRLVWLAASDRPLAPGNDTTRVLAGILEFQRRGAPQAIWNALDAFVPPTAPLDSAMLARMPVRLTRADDQPRLPLTLRVGRDGSVSADTNFARDGRRLRVTVTRIDTTSIKRPF
jgi:hypothetical protein